MPDMEQLQKERERRLLSEIERKIAHKNIRFVLEHQDDTLEQLTAYLKACAEDIGHVPARVEIIGGDLIEYRFGSWERAIGSFYHGKITTIKHPPAFAERKIVQDMIRAQGRGGRRVHSGIEGVRE